jgi:chromosome segregation ATPase
MNNRTAEERRLKTDIHMKNTLRSELSRSLSMLNDWQDRLHGLGNIRKARKLAETVTRYTDYVNELREYLVPVLDELEARIKAEMKFSEEEISQFRGEVSDETREAEAARSAFQKAREALEKLQADEKADPEALASARETYRKAFRTFRLEKRQLKHAKGELSSELVDRDIFKAELKRIMVERTFVSG